MDGKNRVYFGFELDWDGFGKVQFLLGKSTSHSTIELKIGYRLD